MFAQDGARSYLERASLALVLDVARRAADSRERVDLDAVAERDARFNHRVRSDRDALAELGTGINDCGGMDHARVIVVMRVVRITHFASRITGSFNRFV